METTISSKRLEYNSIKAEVKKFASGNDFTLEKNFAIVPVFIKFDKPFGLLDANKDYPAYLVSAKLRGKNPYHLIFWLFNNSTDTIAANALIKFKTSEITDSFKWNGLHYQKRIDSLTNTFNFKTTNQ